MRIWTHPRFLKWLPAVALLAGWKYFPELRTGDHREGTWADPHSVCFYAALLYLIVMFGVGLNPGSPTSIMALRLKGNGGCRRSVSRIQPAATIYERRQIDVQNAEGEFRAEREPPKLRKTTTE